MAAYATGSFDDEAECDYLYKAVTTGDSAVGKSNLLSRYANDEFRLDSKPTIGVEFAYRTVKIGDKMIKAQIWDTAGQERFRAITSSYYRGALGAMLMYDITRRTTLDNIKKWLKELREFGSSDMVITLIGNKSDLSDSREVPEDEGRGFAEAEDLFFMETSALENKNVEEAFLLMITKIHELNTQKALEDKTINDITRSLHGEKQTIHIVDQHEVSETKATRSFCCSS